MIYAQQTLRFVSNIVQAWNTLDLQTIMQKC